jgi:hypothetical protein
MSNWRDAFNENPDEVPAAPATWHDFQTHFLDLADFLCGTFAGKEGRAIPPGSLSLWVEEGRLKCCLKVKAKGVVGFCVIHQPDQLLAELEALLHEGRIEWRKEGARKRS